MATTPSVIDTTSSKAPITVIIPVYKDVELTIKCINSCLPGVKKEGAHVVIVNDFSPEPFMKTALEKLAIENKNYITIISNEQNLGFVKSVNLGIRLAIKTNVVLLNSDVIVPVNWLTTLRNDIALKPFAGTLTPLTNNSTISSIPLKNQGSKIFLAYDVDILNSAIQGSLPLVATPSGVGCCMYITKECLEQVGPLNENEFGLGYGEENDFCQRALKKGFINYITSNLYCHHVGSVSFGDLASEKISRGLKVVHKLHPNYHADVHDWIRRDPLKHHRIIRNHQMCRANKIPIVLFVTHGLGGGTQQHIDSLIQSFGRSIYPIILKGKRSQNDFQRLYFGWPSESEFDELIITEDCTTGTILGSFMPDLVHIHHLAGISKAASQWLMQLNTIPLITTYHDFYMMNGNPTLTDLDGIFKGIEASFSEHIINHRTPLPFEMEEWHSSIKVLIDASCLNIFPCNDAKIWYQKAFGEIKNSAVVPHEEIVIKEKIKYDKVNTPDIRLIVIGALSKEKGADFLEKLAESAQVKSKGAVSVQIIGYAYKKIRGVKQTGPYQQHDLDSLILQSKADVIFFAARWPETYSYTLSAAIKSGLPIVAPAIGAFPERLDGYPKHLLYSISDSADTVLSKIIDFMQASGEKEERDMILNSFYSNSYADLIQSRSCLSEKDALVVYNSLQNATTADKIKSCGKRQRIFNLLFKLYRIMPFSETIPLKWARLVKNIIYPYPLN